MANPIFRSVHINDLKWRAGITEKDIEEQRKIRSPGQISFLKHLINSDINQDEIINQDEFLAAVATYTGESIETVTEIKDNASKNVTWESVAEVTKDLDYIDNDTVKEKEHRGLKLGIISDEEAIAESQVVKLDPNSKEEAFLYQVN